MKRFDEDGFTLIELLTVISIIAVLSGLVLSTAGFIQKKAATSRAQAEIKAMEAACESYKADNGTYPVASGTTDLLAVMTNLPTPALSTRSLDYDPTQATYKNSSLYLYSQLSGDTTYTGQVTSGAKVYMEFKPAMLGVTLNGQQISTSNHVTSIVDPFGYSYGYSTAYIGTSGTSGNNPTFDLWSTAGSTSLATSGTQAKWIKNW